MTWREKKSQNELGGVVAKQARDAVGCTLVPLELLHESIECVKNCVKSGVFKFDKIGLVFTFFIKLVQFYFKNRPVFL
jgi:hypothetical protein